MSMKVGIIGLGLIGGSIAKECKRKGHEVIGYDANESHAKRAEELGFVDCVLKLEKLLKEVEIIGLCIPVDLIESELPSILNRLKDNQVIFDVGSTKAKICQAVKDHPRRNQFVAAHPMAGTEFSGPEAAILDLFSKKKNIICEEHLSSQKALEVVLDLFNSFGMLSIFMNAENHDKHMAYVSHLSHISAYALSATVLDIEKDEKQIQNLAGTGFASTVRIAKSNPNTWASIFEKNKKHVLVSLNSYIQNLEQFKKLLEADDDDGVKQYIKKANEIKRILSGINKNAIKLS